MLKEGDTVTLKVGGPRMVIGRIHWKIATCYRWTTSYHTVYDKDCVEVSSEERGGYFEREQLPVAALVAA